MARVMVLLTGGTLASVPDDDGTLTPSAYGAQLATTLPQLGEIAELRTRSLMLRDSSDMRPEHWLQIAEAIREHYGECDGFVVVHGTDTMAYTASALSFMLPDLSKPVVLTGSQRPVFEPRSDARTNLIDAVTVATMPVPEVSVCLASVLLRGNRCRKQSTVDFTAFASPDFPPLAKLGVDIELSDRVLPPRGVPGMPLAPPLALEERVCLKVLTPTTRPEEFRVLGEIDTRGLVLLAFGAGNLPLENSALIDAISALEVPCVVLSQCRSGPTNLRLYQGGSELARRGFIDGGDMTAEAALTKLMCALGSQLEGQALVRYMTSSVAGERR